MDFHIIEYLQSLLFGGKYLTNVDSITNLGFKEFPFDEPEMLLSMSLVEVTSWKAVISLLIKVRNTSIRSVSCFWRLYVGSYGLTMTKQLEALFNHVLTMTKIYESLFKYGLNVTNFRPCAIVFLAPSSMTTLTSILEK